MACFVSSNRLRGKVHFLFSGVGVNCGPSVTPDVLVSKTETRPNVTFYVKSCALVKVCNLILAHKS
jgi:hypothetical protein